MQTLSNILRTSTHTQALISLIILLQCGKGATQSGYMQIHWNVCVFVYV